MTTTKPDRMDQELLDMAAAQKCLGLMDEATFRKINVRHSGSDVLPSATLISGEENRQAH